MSEVAKHIFFSGRVQGVGFRFTALRIAQRYSLAGYVRNCSDGRVEMFAQGLAKDIDNCLRDISESFAGYVKNSEINDMPPSSTYQNFRITF